MQIGLVNIYYVNRTILFQPTQKLTLYSPFNLDGWVPLWLKSRTQEILYRIFVRILYLITYYFTDETIHLQIICAIEVMFSKLVP